MPRDWAETGAPICPRRERRRERPQQPPPRSPESKYVRSYVRKYLPVVSLPLFSRLATPPRPHSSSVCGVLAYVRTYVRTYVRVGVVVYVSTHVRTQERIIQWCGRAGGGASSPRPTRKFFWPPDPPCPAPPSTGPDRPHRSIQGPGQDPPTWPGDRHAHPPQGMGIDFTSTGER